MKDIYILLTRTNTIASRIIFFLTRDEYTHVSICLDEDLTRMYSFGRKNPFFPFPAGFIREQICRGVYRRNASAPCLLSVLHITDEAYARIKKHIMLMIKNREQYRFNLIGTVTCKFGKTFVKENRYFCSQFVASLLESSGEITLPKEPALMHPADFKSIPGLEEVYHGTLCGLTSEKIVTDVQIFFSLISKSIAWMIKTSRAKFAVR